MKKSDYRRRKLEQILELSVMANLDSLLNAGGNLVVSLGRSPELLHLSKLLRVRLLLAGHTSHTVAATVFLLLFEHWLGTDSSVKSF